DLDGGRARVRPLFAEQLTYLRADRPGLDGQIPFAAAPATLPRRGREDDPDPVPMRRWRHHAPPWRRASCRYRAIASARLVALSLRRICRTWDFTVVSDTVSRLAISALVAPLSSSCITSRSRGVRPSAGSGGGSLRPAGGRWAVRALSTISRAGRSSGLSPTART